MADQVRLSINGAAITVPPGTTVAAAVLRAGVGTFRRSVTGEARGPVCGMGICFECCLTIDGHPHQRSCQTLCREGMEVETVDASL